MSNTVNAGDVVGIGIHTGNALRGYEIGRRRPGARRLGRVRRHSRHAVSGRSRRARRRRTRSSRGDGDLIWPRVVADCLAGHPMPVYEGGRIDGDQFASARWDLLPSRRYMWASVQTVRGCPKHCSFCSVWRTDGQEPRQRGGDRVVREVVELRRLGFRFIALADDNFYPVTFDDLAQARRRADPTRLRELEALRDERFELMARLAELPDDLVFYTQITMEAAEDPEFLDAMKRAQDSRRAGRRRVGHPRGPQGRLQGLQPGRRRARDAAARVPAPRDPHTRLVHLRPAERYQRHVRRDGGAGGEADLTFAQFVLLTPFPGTVDFEKWAAEENRRGTNGRRRAGDTALADSGTASAVRSSARRPSDDVVRGHPRRHAGRLGSLLQLAARLGAVARRRIACGPASPSCWSRSYIARCTRTPASRPTARASSDRRGGHDGLGARAPGSFSANRCRTLQSPENSWPQPTRPTTVASIDRPARVRLEGLRRARPAGTWSGTARRILPAARAPASPLRRRGLRRRPAPR